VGGAIFLDLSNITETNSKYTENESIYGQDKATPKYSIKLVSNQQDLTKLISG